MLATISRALEERDQTNGHGARVAALAEPVARRLGWDVERLAAGVGGPMAWTLTDRGKRLRRPAKIRLLACCSASSGASASIVSSHFVVWFEARYRMVTL